MLLIQGLLKDIVGFTMEMFLKVVYGEGFAALLVFKIYVPIQNTLNSIKLL